MHMARQQERTRTLRGRGVYMRRERGCIWRAGRGRRAALRQQAQLLKGAGGQEILPWAEQHSEQSSRSLRGTNPNQLVMPQLRVCRSN